MRSGLVLALSVGLGFGACAARSGSGGAPSSAKRDPSGTALPGLPPKAAMNLEQARRYVLALVNRDRAEHGLGPVVMDETANRAGQRHAEDMAQVGYTAHWGSDGSVPEQRYSQAGGTDFVQENAGCLADGKSRKLDAAPRFEAEELERVERAFMDEKPPHDGHRKNILKPRHTGFGVGVAKPSGVGIACLSQEFVDDYGDYGALPKSARAGDVVTISGDVKGPVTFGGVGVGRIDSAQPLTASYLNTTYTYAVPTPSELYFPKGFVTKKPVEVNGKHFRIELPLGKRGQAGRYEVSIWGKFPGAGQQLEMVSLRVIDVH
ncbi:MAG TPA: CAP domain-containing protein [Polyangiaceae bacterium]|nr:CAP domain-containing protein [Polyangiaceae bacterium]